MFFECQEFVSLMIITMVGYNKSIAIFILLNIMIFSCTSVSSHNVPCPPPAAATPNATKGGAKCPRDTLKFGVCGDWLGLVHEVVGAPPSNKCCTLLEGLADLEAALCLCTAIKANVLGVLNLKIPIALSLLINSCGKKVPDGYQCG